MAAETVPPAAAMQMPSTVSPPPFSASPRAYSLLRLLVLSLLLLQRLTVPGTGKIPLLLLVTLVLLGFGVASGVLRVDPIRGRLYALAVGLLTLLAFVALCRGRSVSLNSLFFVPALYLIGIFTVHALDQETRDRVLRLFGNVMCFFAGVSLAQLGIQYAGVKYQDYLALFVPKSLLIPGYNTGNPITYGSPIYRSNGVLFLEPSFVSLFLGLALVISIYQGRRSLVLILLAAGIVPTLAGNGLVVAIPGIVAIAGTDRARYLGRLVAPLVVALAVAVVTPLGSLFATRSSEFHGNNTSSSLRLILPYDLLVPAIRADISTMLLGRGPGEADRLIAATRIDGLLTPTTAKLGLEYGLVGGIVFLLFLLYVFLNGSTRLPWMPGLLLAYFILNAALLQTVLALAPLVFLSLLKVNEGPDGSGQSEPAAVAPGDQSSSFARSS